MNLEYNDKTDLVYIGFDQAKGEVINKRVADDIVLDMGENERIIGIEIQNASHHLNLHNLLPMNYRSGKTA